MKKAQIKWAEIISLAVLNASVVISWIAYHEYQPKLLEVYHLEKLNTFLQWAKIMVMVLIPPLAGWAADQMMRKQSPNFLVYNLGIALTAIIFMLVASVISVGPDSPISKALPVLIVIWLIAMNLFFAPANSLLELFASRQKLPVAMGVIVLVTESVYALEPVIIKIINNIGPTLTFVAGGVLVAIGGIVLKRLSSDEIQSRKDTLRTKSPSSFPFLRIIVIGFLLGGGFATLKAYIPDILIAETSWKFDSETLASLLILLGAITAVPISLMVEKQDLSRVISAAIPVLLLSVLGIYLLDFALMPLTVLLILSYITLNVSSLPFVFRNTSPGQMITAVGTFFGASELVENVIELMLN